MRNHLGKSDKDRIFHLLAEVVAWVLCVSNVVAAAGIFNNYLPMASSLSVYANILCVLGAAPLLFLQGQFKTLVLAGVIVCLLIVGKASFAYNFAQPFAFGGGIEFTNILSFMPLMALPIQPNDLLKKLFVVSLGYMVFYLAVSSSISSLDYGEGIDVVGYIGDADDRGARVLVATTFAAFTFFFGFYHLRRGQALVGSLAVCASLAAIYLSGTRFFLLPLVASFALSMLPLGTRIAASKLVAWGYVAVTLYLGLSIFAASHNPFAYFSSDGSGFARQVEFEIARVHLTENPIFGIGFSQSGSLQYQMLVNGYVPFFSGDIGPIGVWADFGLLGLFLYTGLSVFMIRLVSLTKSESAPLKALEATLVTVALYGLLAPVSFLGSGRLLTGIALALGLLLLHRRKLAIARNKATRRNLGMMRSTLQ